MMVDHDGQQANDPVSGNGFSHCVLGESSQTLPLESWADNRAAALSLVGQARRTLDIFTFDLEPSVYDHPPLLDAIRALALRSRHSRVRVLVKDSRRAVKDGHRLVDLARNLSTFIQIRKAHDDVRDFAEAFLIADAVGTLHRTLATRYEGSARFRAGLHARQLTQWFNEVWERSVPDPELRRLHL
ncbi:MAG: acyltransferase [Gammaproteobacteria bacterium]